MENREWEQFKTEIKKQFSIFRELLQHRNKAKHMLLDVFEGNSEYSRDVITVLGLIRKSKSERTTAIAGMLAFLWEYEGNYMSNIDAFCYLLIANGHDLLDVMNRNYVKSLEDIRNVDASTKFRFLKEHDFGILNREKDKKLRNKIAHHDFILNHSGKINIDETYIDIDSRFNELSAFNSKIFRTLVECLDEC